MSNNDFQRVIDRYRQKVMALRREYEDDPTVHDLLEELAYIIGLLADEVLETEE